MPSAACFTSHTIWPMFISTVSTRLASGIASMAARHAAYGYGLSVIGRNSATRRPSFFTSSIAVLQMRAIVPKATSSRS